MEITSRAEARRLGLKRWIFHQNKPHEWGPVIQGIAVELREQQMQAAE